MYKVKIITAHSYKSLQEEVNTFLEKSHDDFLYGPEIKISDSSCMASIVYNQHSSQD